MYLSLRGTDDPKPQYTGAVIGLVAFVGVFVLYKYLDRRLAEESGKVDIHKKRKRTGISIIAIP